MSLNHDCLREILIFINKNCKDDAVDIEFIVTSLSNKYDATLINELIHKLVSENFLIPAVYFGDTYTAILKLTNTGQKLLKKLIIN